MHARRLCHLNGIPRVISDLPRTSRFAAVLGEGPIRVLYFTVLISHIILAALTLPLALITLRRGLRRDDARHTAIARWTLPIWLYVSVTGVLVYWMLYQL